MKDSPALLIFIKNPKLGHVKTRLAQSVGNARALQIYQALLAHTRQISLQLNVERYLFYSQFVDEQDEWPEKHFNKLLQQAETDLGGKMSTAFELVLSKHPVAIIIGSDCASLDSTLLEVAFEKLKEYPYVIGPASDGGYYLLGMRQSSPHLFKDMHWSTDSVLPVTLERITQSGSTHFLLPELSDIDYEEDWQRFGWELED